MQDNSEEGSFWTSYADLLTALFLLTLVLFVVTYRRMAAERDRLEASQRDLQRLRSIQAAIRSLEDREHFEYQPQFKRYVLRRQVQFAKQDAVIDPRQYGYLRETGESVARLMETLQADPSRRGVHYLIVIEGMASRDLYDRNFELSYARALSLYRFWTEHNIRFNPAVCEVLIAGSGTQGVGRYLDETKNQRFLIQIIPKIDL